LPKRIFEYSASHISNDEFKVNIEETHSREQSMNQHLDSKYQVSYEVHSPKNKLLTIEESVDELQDHEQ